MRADDEWRDLIASYRARHDLTQAQFAGRINVTQQTVSRWESGRQRPDSQAKQMLRTAVGLTALTSNDAWRERVEMSWGLEALLASGWRVVALSPKLHQLTRPGAKILGQSLFDLPKFRAYAPRLRHLPVFDGSLRVVKARANISHNGTIHAGEVELWPVLSCADDVLLHAIIHLAPKSERDSHSEGLHEIMALAVDGRELATDAPAAKA